MKARTAGMKLGLVALPLGLCVSAFGQAPVISSFSQNGELVCTNLQPGSVATVEWASSVTGKQLGGAGCGDGGLERDDPGERADVLSRAGIH